MEQNGNNPFGHNALDLSGLGKPRDAGRAVQIQVEMKTLPNGAPVASVATAFQSREGWCFPIAENTPQGTFVVLSERDKDDIAERVMQKMMAAMQASMPHFGGVVMRPDMVIPDEGDPSEHD